jgi:hypothetical protein
MMIDVMVRGFPLVSVEGLASNRHDALTERVFRLVRRVSQEHEHAHFAEGTTGRLLKDGALPVPPHH